MAHKLSIITVNLNNRDGLEATIKSVASQTTHDFEFIVIDGGSMDRSLAVIDSHQGVISHWLSEKDTGVYQAMNKGIAMAKGEYLLFLNSGDYLYSNDTLSNVFSVEHKEDFLCGRSAISQYGAVVHITEPPEVHTFATYYHATISHQATFIKREMFRDYGLYREDFKYNSDWEFWIRTIILQGCSTKKIDEIICYYNLDGMSSTNNHSAAYLQEIKVVLEQPILTQFVPDYELWRNERKAMAPFYWLRSKKLLFKIFISFYGIARRLNRK